MEDNINYVDKYVEVISLINETHKYRFLIYSFPSYYLFIYLHCFSICYTIAAIAGPGTG